MIRIVFVSLFFLFVFPAFSLSSLVCIDKHHEFYSILEILVKLDQEQAVNSVHDIYKRICSDSAVYLSEDSIRALSVDVAQWALCSSDLSHDSVILLLEKIRLYLCAHVPKKESFVHMRAPRTDSYGSQEGEYNDFVVNRNISVGGDVTVGGKIYLKGGFSAKDANFSQDLEVTGMTTVHGDTVFGFVPEKSVRSLETTTTVGGRLIVHGKTHVNNDVYCESDLSVNGFTKLSHDGTALHVAGAAEKTVGGTTWINASDRRIKENIADADICECLAMIDKIQLKKYCYTDEWCSAEKILKRYEYGVIAQELEEVMPESVITQNVYILRDPKTGSVVNRLENFKKVSLDHVYKMLIGAVQHLHVTCKNQQKEIDILKKMAHV